MKKNIILFIAIVFLSISSGAAQAQDPRPGWLALQVEEACTTFYPLATSSTCDCVIEASFTNISDDDILDDFTNRVKKQRTTKLEDYWFKRTILHCDDGSSSAPKAKKSEAPLIKGLDY